MEIRMHTTKKEEEVHKRKEKFCYIDLFLVATDQTPPRQDQKSIFSKSGASKKKTMHTHHHRPDYRS
jgi:hypothetical protein